MGKRRQTHQTNCPRHVEHGPRCGLGLFEEDGRTERPQPAGKLHHLPPRPAEARPESGSAKELEISAVKIGRTSCYSAPGASSRTSFSGSIRYVREENPLSASLRPTSYPEIRSSMAVFTWWSICLRAGSASNHARHCRIPCAKVVVAE